MDILSFINRMIKIKKISTNSSKKLKNLNLARILVYLQKITIPVNSVRVGNQQ